VADNRGGAGGSLGTAIAARAPADGHTLLINSGAFTVAPAMYMKLPYDTQKDFIDIAALVAMPNVLSVNPSSRLTSISAFIADAKASPGKINFAFAGLGSGTHLNNEKFKLAAKIDYTNVAYKGSGEIFPDLMAGRVDAYFSPLQAGLPYIQSGKLKALGVTSLARVSQLGIRGAQVRVPAVVRAVGAVGHSAAGGQPDPHRLFAGAGRSRGQGAPDHSRHFPHEHDAGAIRQVRGQRDRRQREPVPGGGHQAPVAV
jgi:tripartite-type tricarboxylate transporter receptor subunit TctC